MSDLGKLKTIIDKKKRDDPEGYTKAERNGDLLYYLNKELKEAKLDPSIIISYQKSLLEKDDIDNTINFIANTLDEMIYEPCYQNNLSKSHLGLSEVLVKYKDSSPIIKPLKRLKVATAIIGLFCFGLSISNMTKYKIPQALILIIIAHDLIRISYNCYDKRYCSLYISMLSKNVSNVTDTIFQFAKSAIGLTSPSEDPLIKLYSEIQWLNMLEDTLSIRLFHKVILVYQFLYISYLYIYINIM